MMRNEIFYPSLVFYFQIKFLEKNEPIWSIEVWRLIYSVDILVQNDLYIRQLSIAPYMAKFYQMQNPLQVILFQ